MVCFPEAPPGTTTSPINIRDLDGVDVAYLKPAPGDQASLRGAGHGERRDHPETNPPALLIDR